MTDERARPNVLLVVVDDMGAYQLGCYGSRFYETPNLDRWAATARRFSEAYASSPVCSPSRAGLYTGRHPARLHLTNFIPGSEAVNAPLRTPDWRTHLPVEERALGDVFKAAGYATAHFGKWHLAPDYHYRPFRPGDPESHGFDEVIVTRKPTRDASPEDDPHHVHDLTERVVRFVQTPRDKPFLCVLAHNAIHRPEMAPAAQVARFATRPGADRDAQRPVLAAMVAEVDLAFGRLMSALRESGRDRDTIVVFTADHGAMARSEELKPWRGAKADLYEAGLRVPFILSSPDGVSAGVDNRLTQNCDLLPTLCGLTGVSLPTVEIDGRDLFREGSPANEADADASTALFWHFPHYHHLGIGPCAAVRRGRYKLVEWFDATRGGLDDRPGVELFDLRNDPCEQRDLSARNPALAEELLAQLRDWRRRVGAQEMAPNPDYDPARGYLGAPPPAGDATSPYLS